MSHENQWVWSALEGLVDLTGQHDEAVTEAERLAGRISEEKSRILEATGLSDERQGAIIETMQVLGSPLDIDNPREPAAEAPATADPLDVPPFLDRRGEAAQ